MSSSPSRATAANSAVSPPPMPNFAAEIVAFPYAEVLAGAGMVPSRGHIQLGQDDPAQVTREIAERETRARALGREEGQAEGRKNFDELLVRERSAVDIALTQFAADRAAHYQKVEVEVVQLALSIAGKILHRESQV
ncbi:MAG TPA: hypothetical protein VI386_18265, partial [Candidatus Sulfotelmatobacter sp.]